jgi:hypothetical protein
LGGNVIVTSQADPPDTATGTLLVKFVAGNYVTTLFDAHFVTSINEGANFVDCDAVTPTPTPTATFTPTPTPTATFTPTPTPTVTPTPTPTPSGVCPLTQGFWKNHPGAWPVHSLTLGTQIYNMGLLLAILNTPSGGDASIILAKQLIAAKLNIANGSDPTPIAATIATADALLDGCVLPCHVPPSSTLGMQMTAAAAILDQYNNGQLTPGCSGG